MKNQAVDTVVGADKLFAGGFIAHGKFIKRAGCNHDLIWLVARYDFQMLHCYGQTGQPAAKIFDDAVQTIVGNGAGVDFHQLVR